jgi:hypothetical protein
MPGDAKLGLVVGVGMVILLAVLFRRDGSLVVPAGPRPISAGAPASQLPPAERGENSIGLAPVVEEARSPISE